LTSPQFPSRAPCGTHRRPAYGPSHARMQVSKSRAGCAAPPAFGNARISATIVLYLLPIGVANRPLAELSPRQAPCCRRGPCVPRPPCRLPRASRARRRDRHGRRGGRCPREPLPFRRPSSRSGGFDCSCAQSARMHENGERVLAGRRRLDRAPLGPLLEVARGGGWLCDSAPRGCVRMPVCRRATPRSPSRASVRPTRSIAYCNGTTRSACLFYPWLRS
jgi:hypothetical protein